MPALDEDKIQSLEKRTTISHPATGGLISTSVIYQAKQKEKEISMGAGLCIKQKPSDPKDKAKHCTLTRHQEKDLFFFEELLNGAFLPLNIRKLGAKISFKNLFPYNK